MMIAQASITLLVSGSIAAYKSAELVRELVRLGAKVHVVMSKAACEFITPLTMQTLSGNRVTTSLFDAEREAEINHIALADNADLVLAAPATADLIAKMAGGFADDSLSTVLLATRAPVVIAPAMNVNMWRNKITQRNVEQLKEAGVTFVDPDSGPLACGWVGEGRFAELNRIIETLQYVLSPKDLSGSRVVVAAGPTREPIDPVRFVSNLSSGKMGYAIARVAHWQGAQVSLVSGPTSLPPPEGVELYRVNTAEEMRNQVMELVMRPAGPGEEERRKKQYVYMVAAVTDHRPADPSATKLKPDKAKGYDLHMEPCPDILQELGERRSEIEAASNQRMTLVGFTAETGDQEELLASAREKLQRKNADLMVGNFAKDALGMDTNRVWLLERDGRQQEVATADKLLVARKIVAGSLKA